VRPRSVTTSLVLAVLGASCAAFVACRGDVAAAASSPRVPVVVELFSSEGCSSCPPADASLAALDRTQAIDGVAVIALEEHVDYWDHLGWRDPFGSPAASARQSAYARVLPDHQVFTPEMVLDGHLVVPSGDEGAAREMMQRSAREPKAHVALRREGARVSVDVSDVPPVPGDVPAVWLAITESGLATDVLAGENAGRRLVHAPIARRLRSLGAVDGPTFHADATIDADLVARPNVRVLAFVQLAKSMAIVGAATL
jgi:hypothetical protein